MTEEEKKKTQNVMTWAQWIEFCKKKMKEWQL